MADVGGQKIDADDFERQLAAARDVSVTEDLREIITGQSDARETFRIAKQNALLKARRVLVRQIEAANDRMQERRLVPVAVDQDVRTWIEDGGAIKVKA